MHRSRTLQSLRNGTLAGFVTLCLALPTRAAPHKTPLETNPTEPHTVQTAALDSAKTHGYRVQRGLILLERLLPTTRPLQFEPRAWQHLLAPPGDAPE